jgi:DNA polymerase-1
VHHAQGAIRALAGHGIALAGLVGDGALGSYLLDPTRHLPHHLDQVARDQLHVALQPLHGLLGKGRERVGFFDLTVDRAGAWACHRADAAGAVWERIAPQLVREQLDRELQAVDLPLSHVLAAMEARGVGADVAKLESLEKAFAAERRQVAQQVYTAAGRRFTIGSGKQLGTVLFDELDLPIQGRTKTGYQTSAAVLRKLEGSHPIVPLVQRYKVLDTLIQTYTKPLRRAVGPDGRIHPTYVCTHSASGRILTTEPDLQRTPVATDESAAIREALVAAPGHVLVRADWSQLELRLLAHLAQDAALIDAYRRGDDVHRRTAAAVLDLDPADVTAADREVGKAVNYATVYGQGPAALGEQLGLPSASARTFIDAFFQAWPGIAAWRDRTIVEAHTHGFVTTWAGRRRYLPELTHRDRADQAYGERAALNTPIQGSGADLCKRALLAAHRDLPLGAGLVLQVHDELLVECREDQVDEVVDVLRRSMEEVAELDVPLPVSVGVGRSWREAHDG